MPSPVVPTLRASEIDPDRCDYTAGHIAALVGVTRPTVAGWLRLPESDPRRPVRLPTAGPARFSGEELLRLVGRTRVETRAAGRETARERLRRGLAARRMALAPLGVG